MYRNLIIKKTEILILGMTFKENCSDIRNTKVLDIVESLSIYKANLNIVDPLVDCQEVRKIYGIKVANHIPLNVKYSVVICAVGHNKYLEFKKKDWEKIITQDGFFFDLKGFLPRELDVIRP